MQNRTINKMPETDTINSDDEINELVNVLLGLIEEEIKVEEGK